MKVKLVDNLFSVIRMYDKYSLGVYSWMHPNYKTNSKIRRYFRTKQGKIVSVRKFRGDTFDKIHDIFLPKGSFKIMNLSGEWVDYL